MSESLGDFEFQVRLDKALRDAEELEQRLDDIRNSSPPRDEYEALSRELARAKKEAAALLREQQAGKKAADEQAAATAKLAAAQERAAKAASEGQGRVRNNLVQAIGGDELPERLSKIGESFAAVSDRSQGFGSRITGLVGAVGLAVPAFSMLYSGVDAVMTRFGAWGAIEGYTDRIWSAIRGTESHAEAALRQSTALAQSQMAMAAIATQAQKDSDALGSVKTSVDAGRLSWEQHNAITKETAIEDQRAIANWEVMQDRSTQLAVGIDLTTLAQQRAAEATQRQADTVERLRDVLQDAAKAQGDLSYAVRQGESAADRITRIFQGTRLRAEQIILENRERAQIGRAERTALQRQGYSASEVNTALGSLGYSAPSGGGGNNALRQAKLEFADVMRQLHDAGGEVELFDRKRGQSMTAYYQALRTETQAALDAQRRHNELLQQQHDLEKQALVDIENKQRALADSTRELEKQRLVVRQQFADIRQSVGNASGTASMQRDAENLLGLRGFVPGSEDRSAQRSMLLGRIDSLGAEAAANPQDEQLQQRLQTQAQAIQQTITQYDQLRVAQADAMDWSRQFTLAFQSHAELTNTAAQNLAQSASGYYSSLTGAVTKHFAALITGQEDAATAGRLFVNEISTQIASQSLPLALFETAQAIAAAASYRFVEAGQHAAAAGIYFGLTAGGAALSAATSTSSAKGFASNTKSFSEPARSTSSSPSRDEGGRTVVFNYYGGMSIDTKDDIARNVINALDHGFARGHIPRVAMREIRT